MRPIASIFVLIAFISGSVSTAFAADQVGLVERTFGKLNTAVTELKGSALDSEWVQIRSEFLAETAGADREELRQQWVAALSRRGYTEAQVMNTIAAFEKAGNILSEKRDATREEREEIRDLMSGMAPATGSLMSDCKAIKMGLGTGYAALGTWIAYRFWTETPFIGFLGTVTALSSVLLFLEPGNGSC